MATTTSTVSNGQDGVREFQITGPLHNLIGKQVYELKAGLRITYHPSTGHADLEFVHDALEMELRASGIMMTMSGSGSTMNGTDISNADIDGKNAVTKSQFTIRNGKVVEKPWQPPENCKAPAKGIVNNF